MFLFNTRSWLAVSPGYCGATVHAEILGVALGLDLYYSRGERMRPWATGGAYNRGFLWLGGMCGIVLTLSGSAWRHQA